jgi:hypothetical protein
MTREQVIDAIREELKRQQDRDALSLHVTDTPDVLEIHGRVDLLAVASSLLMRLQ